MTDSTERRIGGTGRTGAKATCVGLGKKVGSDPNFVGGSRQRTAWAGRENTGEIRCRPHLFAGPARGNPEHRALRPSAPFRPSASRRRISDSSTN